MYFWASEDAPVRLRRLLMQPFWIIGYQDIVVNVYILLKIINQQMIQSIFENISNISS